MSFIYYVEVCVFGQASWVRLRRHLRKAEDNKSAPDVIRKDQALLDSAADWVLNTLEMAGEYANLESSHPKNRTVADQVRIEIGQWLEDASHEAGQ